MKRLPHFWFVIAGKEYMFYGKNRAEATNNAVVWASKRGATAKLKKGQ